MSQSTWHFKLTKVRKGNDEYKLYSTKCTYVSRTDLKQKHNKYYK